MDNLNPNFGKGAIKDTPDERDIKFGDFGTASIPFDWVKGYDIESIVGKLPVKNQGLSYSCGGQAWSIYGTALNAVGVTIDNFSAKWIYSQVFVPGGGSSGRACSEILTKKGLAKESSLTSMEKGLPPSELFMQRVQDITPAITATAINKIALSYAYVDADIDTIAQAIRDNYGCVLGIEGSNNNTWLSAYPLPPKLGDDVWRHWEYSGKAKLINGKKYIATLNSWGDKVGEKGWQWLGEDYFKNYINDSKSIWTGWTIIPKITLVTTPPFLTNMSYGQSGNEIKRLQLVLKRFGYFPATQEATGFYGSVTAISVQKFQREKLFLNGKSFGKKSRDALNLLLNI